MEDSQQQPPQQIAPMTIDGADEDLALANSSVLTRREVLVRRLRRVRQLSRCYRGHYWALMEELKAKYREYYWTYGRSPFKEDEERNSGNASAAAAAAAVDNGDDFVRCASSGCKTKAMALTKYCHAHILSDPNQKLYRGCTAVAKSLPTGPVFCNKPVLRSMVPLVCPAHYQLGEKCLLRAVKRAGHNVPVNGKPSPQLHLLIPEFVRQIQNKRKAARKAALPKPETD